MKRTLSILLAALMLLSVFSVLGVSAEATQSAPTGFKTWKALFAHAVSGSDEGDAWLAWQSIHNEDFAEENPTVKYFFLPSSADTEKVDIYNAFSETVTVNGTKIGAGRTETVSYAENKDYSVKAENKVYTLRFMRSGAEAAVYVNNSDADGDGTELMTYLNFDKERSAKATGAIVTPDGAIDNTTIKKIKGRGNTTWGKPKKAYNITYDSKVSVAGMNKSKKYSILANYQDDSLSRNRFLYDLSDAVGMPYASDSRYVDFYSNGFYWGSYQMAEKVEAGSSSLVSDFEEEDYLSPDGKSVKEDFPFICEVDAGAMEGADYFVTIPYGIKITIKAPELDPGDVGYEEVKKYVADKFTAFYNAAASRTGDLSEYGDVDSLAKLYLINELGKNWDAGVSSMFLTYKPDENGAYKFYGSPVWDYDNSLGNAVGVGGELSNMGVSDYEEYTGWWCQYKGKSAKQKSSTNIMNRLSVNKSVTDAAKKIWAEKFIPAINHFAGTEPNSEIEKELYTADEYYNLIKDSAAMNYKSGWLLNTGDWIADHTSLKTAVYDAKNNVYNVNKNATKYANNFKGMYDYCRDWMISRASWLSKEMAVVPPTVGEVDNKVEETEKQIPSSYKLSKSSYTYDGKAKKPSVRVKDKDGKVISSDSYSVSYGKGRKNVGRYSVKVVMKGGYKGSKTLYFKINPAAAKLKGVTPKKKSFTAKWTKKTKQTMGYQLQYSTNIKFKKAVKKTVKNAKTVKLTVKKLKAKTYYVRVRTYKTTNGENYYSKWSKTVTVKVKK